MKQKHFAKFTPPLMEMPNMTEAQMTSFKWILEKGIKELFKEFSPISDYSGKKFDLHFLETSFTPPAYNEHHAKDQKLNLEGQLKARVKLVNKMLGTEKEQEIFITDFPV